MPKDRTIKGGKSRLTPIPLTPNLVLFPPTLSCCSDEKGRRGWTFLGFQVWDIEAPNIEPGGTANQSRWSWGLGGILSVLVGAYLLPH